MTARESSRSNPGVHVTECLRCQPAIFLVGFMGAGKTSVGKALAQLLGWTFEDLDDRIQLREGRSVEQIFQTSGEPGFRRAEHAALRDLLSVNESSPRVVALGGGAFVQSENAELLQQAGVVTVFLDAPAEELYRRCSDQGTERPLRRDAEQFSRLYETRHPYYLKAALRVETSGKSVDEVAAEIRHEFELHQTRMARSAM
jgi:shikimate kinase